MRKYFGTDGIRRIANTELTPELVYRVAKAGAYVLSKHSNHSPTILIGRDTRISGTLTRKLKADASVVISASHNTYEFNGIKFFSNKGTKIPDSLEEEIEEAMESGKIDEIKAVNDKIGISEYRQDLIDEYVYFFRKNFDSNIENLNKEDFVVALDTANGATYKVAEKIFKALGIKYHILNNNPNGININDGCGSTHIEMLKKYVKENNISIGFAYDGDGDRCLAVDENGEEIDGDKIMAIISRYLKKKGKLNKDTIVATVMSNLGLHKYAEKNKLELVQTQVGDRYVLEEMIKNGYNFGGEQSGHIIMLDYNPTGDGILTSIMLIQAILEENKKASEMNKIMKVYPQVLINAKVNIDKKYDYRQDKEINDAIKHIDYKKWLNVSFTGNKKWAI